MNTDTKIIFVGGAPRSGTTLVRNILNSHPDVCSGVEFESMPDVVSLWRTIDRKIEKGRISGYLNQAQLQKIFTDLIRSLLEPYRLKCGKPHIAEKTPKNILAFHWLHRLMPEAYLIHVIRDGRDVVSSMMEVASRYRQNQDRIPPFIRGIENAAQTWKRYVTAPFHPDHSISHRIDQHTDKYIEVRYEDIVRQPQSTIRQMCERLSLIFSEKMLRPELYAQDKQFIDPRWCTKVEMDTSINDESIGRWRKDLTFFQRLVVGKVCQKELQRLGYVRDCNWMWSNGLGSLTTKPLDDCRTAYRLIRKMLLNRIIGV